jgi:hypothetical protein
MEVLTGLRQGLHMGRVPDVGMHMVPGETLAPQDRHGLVPPASSMSQHTTRAPCRAKRRALARPMPLAPPVITATLSFNSIGVS